MSRVLWTALFLILILIPSIACWKIISPKSKGYAALSIIRWTLSVGIGIAAVWTTGMMFNVLVIVCLALVAASYLIPVTRPKVDG